MAAVIDIGSGSVKLLCNGKKYIEVTQLGENLKDGLLDAESMRRTAAAITKFAKAAKGDVYAFATEAVRSAENAAVFLALVKAESGLDVEVIDGETEAKCGFLSVYDGAEKAVLDVGGASSELCCGAKEIVYRKSLPFGSVRLRDRFGTDFAALKAFLKQAVTQYESPRYDTLAMIGGTAAAVCAIHLGLREFDPEAIDGKRLSIDDLTLTEERLFSMTYEEVFCRYPFLGERRAKVVAHGCAVLCAVADYLSPKTIIVSTKGCAEGYAVLRGIN